jgi:asparagine synthase (glutamine-hydrolysing)
MCGITALYDRRGGDLLPLIATMTGTLRHRGPDDDGVWQSEDRRVALGHRRLSIIDLSPLGRNPMSWAGRYHITYNGEIYNFRRIREELERSGCIFRSQTDTEVLLAAYERWGLDCLQQLNGMFAFALWDTERSELLLARDRLGKKPLYYAEYGGRIAVASELKAIVADPRFPRVVDPRAVSLYLRYGYVPAPFTIYQHARKLPPAHYAIVREGRVETHRYWDAVERTGTGDAPPVDDGTVEKWCESLLSDAVRIRMLADVPVGAFLSGGIDSSLVVALMQEHSAAPVKTFTVRFDDPAFNEADYAAAVARHLKTDHYEQTCDARQMLEVVDRLPDMFDEPFADSSAIPTYLVSRIARERVTVALSGDGGDELFFGYPRYRHHMNTGWVLGAPRPLRRAAAALAGVLPHTRFRRAADVLRPISNDGDDRYERFISWWNGTEVGSLTNSGPETNPAYADAIRRTAAVDSRLRPLVVDLVTYLPEDILTKVDRASMQVSLETRCPLLDYRFVQMALPLPLAYKLRRGETKWLMRRMLARRVPPALTERPKMGFAVPLTAWLQGPLRARAQKLFESDALEAVGVDAGVARAEWRQFVGGRVEQAHQIWSLVALAMWAERWQPQPLREVAAINR